MSDERNNAQQPEQELSEILRVRRDKLKALQDEGRDPFVRTVFDRTAWSADLLNDYERYAEQTVRVAGRIMSKRGMGKAIFCHIKDDRGRLQVYVRADEASCSRPKRRRSPSAPRV